MRACRDRFCIGKQVCDSSHPQQIKFLERGQKELSVHFYWRDDIASWKEIAERLKFKLFYCVRKRYLSKLCLESDTRSTTGGWFARFLAKPE